jgi:16S rRNA (cytosine1402-N4)-methyltransferase
MIALATTDTHEPVLLEEVVGLLRPLSGGRYVDGTVGDGGHAEAILEHSSPAGRLLGMDRDPAAVERARRRLARFGSRAELRQGDYRELPVLLGEWAPGGCDGTLLDLGLSSAQLQDPARGFSFQNDGPLDMRFDPSSGPTAAELLARWSEPELERILREYGEEPRARAIARAIVRERELRPIRTTAELASLVARASRYRHGRTHPATRTFQALRIAVNRELEGLGRALTELAQSLKPGGRLVVISFHSLEDRAIKHCFRALAAPCRCDPTQPCRCGGPLGGILTKKPLVPSAAEQARNRRARSAKLRAFERQLARAA